MGPEREVLKNGSGCSITHGTVTFSKQRIVVLFPQFRNDLRITLHSPFAIRARRMLLRFGSFRPTSPPWIRNLPLGATAGEVR